MFIACPSRTTSLTKWMATPLRWAIRSRTKASRFGPGPDGPRQNWDYPRVTKHILLGNPVPFLGDASIKRCTQTINQLHCRPLASLSRFLRSRVTWGMTTVVMPQVTRDPGRCCAMLRQREIKSAKGVESPTWIPILWQISPWYLGGWGQEPGSLKKN